MSIEDQIRSGHFAKKQIGSKDRLISWTHQSRFTVGLEFAAQCAGKRILDYGSGDGTFLAMAMSAEHRPARAVGAELEPSVVDDCNARFAEVDGLDFIPIGDLDGEAHAGAYDGVFCMEVLEHVVDLDPIFDQFASLLAPDGRLYVSVPVETGLPLIFKQTYRTIAGWRGIGDYPGIEPYTTGELLASLFPGTRQHIRRPVFTSPDGFESHDHKGFNWRHLCELLANRFERERAIASPIPALTPHLASQVWLQFRKR